MTEVLYIGGCNAENIAARLPGATSPGKIYRIPTALLAQGPVTIPAADIFGQNEKVWQRVQYETGARYLETLRTERFDLIVIDLWRDCYVKLIDADGALISFGWEIIDAPGISAAVEARFAILDRADPRIQSAFERGLERLRDLIATHQPSARIVLLDCPPVARTLHDGQIIPLPERFGGPQWTETYATAYREVLGRYRATFPSALIASFPEGAWTSPDAPWGEAALHYAPAFYDDLAQWIVERLNAEQVASHAIDAPPAHRVAIYCKSFRDDFDRLRLLLTSWQENVPDMPFVLSVPELDMALLQESVPLPPGCVLVTDESYVIPGEPFRYGWFQQQVCKLSVHRLGLADAYLMLDSDSYIVRPFGEELFFTDQIPHVVGSPVTTKYYPSNAKLQALLLEGIDTEPSRGKAGDLSAFVGALPEVRAAYKAWEDEKARTGHAADREHFLRKLFAIPVLAVQPAQIFHTSILQAFEIFLKGFGMDFYDAIRLSPWEYNWYAYFALSNSGIDTLAIRSPVLHFARDTDIEHAKSIGINNSMIHKHFAAVQMAARHFDTVSF